MYYTLITIRIKLKLVLNTNQQINSLEWCRFLDVAYGGESKGHRSTTFSGLSLENMLWLSDEE